jgi:hypothetical protein
VTVKRYHLSYSNSLNSNLTYLQKKAAGYPYKPAGLWYALNDDWKQFYQQNLHKFERKIFTTEPNGYIIPGYKYMYEIEVDMTQICLIKEVQDVRVFHRKYCTKNGSNPMGIDWDKVIEYYSGIEIHNCQILHENVIIYAIQWLKYWGVDSGCIWDLKAMKTINKEEL